jgi:arylsulfatase A
MKTLFCIFLLCLFGSPAITAENRENVVILYYDDMGYGDFGANFKNPKSLTPNLDKFSEQAMRFTHGHSADGVCTPSRYAILTGRYAWRTRLKAGVLGGFSKPLMSKERFTIGTMFQNLGYETAMIGKWHIGMQFYGPNGQAVDLGNSKDALSKNKIDFSKKLTDTPADRGFDYYFGTSASLDMPPYLWIENHTCLTKGGLLKDGKVDFSQATPAKNSDLQEGKSSNGRPGTYDPTFVGSDYLEIQAARIANYFEERATDKKPFFLYIPMPAPHKPWALQEKFKGKAGFTYGDYLIQTDHYTGVILDALKSNGLEGNTIFFVSSDNGPETSAFSTSQKVGHDANGPFKGMKRDNWEGGTRVPFLVRWPGKIKPGVTNHACWQGDFMGTMAEHFGVKLEGDQAEDAESFLPILMGKSMPVNRRPGFIEHSSGGQLAIIDSSGEWKLLDGTGGGGNRKSADSENNTINNAKGKIGESPRQLYNLNNDPGEKNNLLLNPTPEMLAKEKELVKMLQEIRRND